MKYLASAVSFNFSAENFNFEQNGVSCIKFAETCRALVNKLSQTFFENIYKC